LTVPAVGVNLFAARELDKEVRMPAARTIVSLLGTVFIAIALPASGAMAAPQILALLATAGATPLACEDGICTGQFSGFCLQRERPTPGRNAAYRVDGGELTLVLTDAEGGIRRLPAADHVTITTERSYTAVRISIPEALRREWGAVSIALEVGEKVALTPIPKTGDGNPQSESDIALAVGPLRALGDRIVDQNEQEAGAVRLTNSLINALPAHGRTSPDGRTGLWEKVVAPRSDAFPRASVSRARSVYDRCLAKVDRGTFFNLRQCLEVGHDSIMLDLNVKYWKAGPGS
jgi:hypothetical protein